MLLVPPVLSLLLQVNSSTGKKVYYWWGFTVMRIITYRCMYVEIKVCDLKFTFKKILLFVMYY